jgi:CheY-specific phosphatase CheX
MRLNQIIANVLQDASLANFSELAEIVDDACPAVDADYVATIGFAGPQIRGVLAWECTREVAVALCGMGDIPDDVIRDWVGEMANQLLGRVKNKLLAHEVEFSLSTPMVIQGQDMRVPRAKGERSEACVNTARGPVRVVMEHVADEAITYRETPIEVAAHEGDAFLF